MVQMWHVLRIGSWGEDFPAIWNISQPFLNIITDFRQVFKSALRTNGRTDEASYRDAWTHLKSWTYSFVKQTFQRESKERLQQSCDARIGVQTNSPYHWPMLHGDSQASSSLQQLPLPRWVDCCWNISFTNQQVQLNFWNTVMVEGGYMLGIPPKSMYKSKFTGCKSIQPQRAEVGGSNFCSNDCYKSFWVGLSQLCTVRWWNLYPFFTYKVL